MENFWKLVQFKRSGYLYLTIALFVFITLLWVTLVEFYGSGWIKTGSAYTVNSLIGYSYTEGGEVIHKENRSFIQQVSLFSGAATDVVDKSYLVRPVYSFLSSTLVPLFGIYGALLAMNLIGWFIAGATTWLLAFRLTNDQSIAMLSTLFVSIGMGFVIHIGDYSAHLWAFTFYYVGILVLYESRIWQQDRPRHVHLALGSFLALACLEYNTGIVLVLAYILMSLKHSNKINILLGAGLALTAQYLWVAGLNLGYALMSGQWVWYDLYENERGYLSGSLKTWLSLLLENPVQWAGEVISKFIEFLSFDFPLVTAVGILGIVVAAKKQIHRLWPFGLFFILPIAGSMAYAQRAAARGYLVYGISIIIYIAAAWLLVQIYRRGDFHNKGIAISLGLAMIVGQLFWVSAPFTGLNAPIRAYYNGVQHSKSMFDAGPAQIISLTENSETPGLFGGHASMRAAGAYVGGDAVESNHGFMKRVVLALGVRGLVSVYFVFLVAIFLYTRNRNSLKSFAYSLVLIYLLPSILLAASTKNKIVFFNVDEAGPGIDCRTVSYSVDVSDNFLSSWDRTYQREMVLHMFFKPTGVKNAPIIHINGKKIATKATEVMGIWEIDAETWRQQIGNSRTMTVSYNPDGPVRYLGWQASRLDNRQIKFESCSEKEVNTNVFPALELRLKQNNGVNRLIGY